VHRSRFAAVSLGGMGGATLRWAVLNVWPVNGPVFPWPVMIINIVGSVILGMALAEEWVHPRWKLIMGDGVGVGFCGGLTTFSTFAVEVSMMGKAGNGASAVVYVLASVMLAVAGVFAGASLLRRTRAATLPVEGDGWDAS
jgi:CrcB protein